MSLAIYPWQEELARQLAALRLHLPNGLIVAGPRGIGTFELVHAFAKSLLCESPADDGTPCGRCPGCRLAAAGNHPDLRYVLSEAEALPRELPFVPPPGAGSSRKNLYRDILIHQPRSLADFVGLSAHRSRCRSVLVYPADRIRPDAASVFLKMLEEPPEGVIFLLVAEDIENVLPTIRSRCRILYAKPPAAPDALRWLAAQGVADPAQALADAGGMPLAVFEQDEHRVVGEDVREALLALLRKDASGDAWSEEAVRSVARTWPVDAVSLFLQRWAWDLAAVKAGLAPRYFPSEGRALAAVAARAQARALHAWSDRASRLRALSGHPLNARLALIQILFDYQAVFSAGPRKA